MVDIFFANGDGVVDHGYWCRCYSFYCRRSDLNYQNWCCWTLKISYDVYWLTYVPMLLSIAYILSQRSFRCYFRFPFCLLCAAKYNSAVHGCTSTYVCQCVRELGPAPVFVVQAICIPINSNVCTKFHCCCWLHTYMQCTLFTLTFVYCCSEFSTIYTFPYFLFISNEISYSIQTFRFYWISKHFYLLNFFYNLAVGLTQLRTKFTSVDWIFKISTDNAMNLSVVPTGGNSQKYLMTVSSFRFSRFDT